MSTLRLYYDDAFAREFSAQVLGCEPVAAEAGSSPVASWRVRLDRTAFYPSSGGQPQDTGRLGDANVIDVFDEGEEVIHIVDRAIGAGVASGRIDWHRRFDHMQQHTGQHLLSAVLQQKFSLATVSFHLGADLCTIDVRGREPTQEILEGAAAAANEIVYEDRAVRVKYGTGEELAASGVRKTVERPGLLRAIEIEDVELQPCGGTHVRRTGQIGMIVVRGISKIRQDWRVEFACGRRAERLTCDDFTALKAVAQRLNCSAQEAIAAAERVVAERDAHFKSARASIEKLAIVEARSHVQECERGADGLRLIAKLYEGEPAEYVQCFAREVAKFEKTVALVVRCKCGTVFFVQHPSAGKDMNALLAELLKIVPGKGGGSRDSARGRLVEPQRAMEFLTLAAARLRPGQ
jgi:alanyl-tRNA synthetase